MISSELPISHISHHQAIQILPSKQSPHIPDLTAHLPSDSHMKADQPRSIFVFDHDDMLKDEKGLNYQLMHNALHQVAYEHGDKYPVIREIATLVEQHRIAGHQDGQPRLVMTQEQFRDQGMKTDHVLEPFYFNAPANGKPHAFNDLLKRLDSLKPNLSHELINIDKLEKLSGHAIEGRPFHDRLETMLFVEFKRQYNRLLVIPQDTKPLKPIKSESTQSTFSNAKAALDQSLRKMIATLPTQHPFFSKTQARQLSPQHLPFPNVSIELLPGAADVLKRAKDMDALIFVITNRSHAFAEKEYQVLQSKGLITTDIHALSGRPTLSENGLISEDRWVKPDSTRLDAVLKSIPSESAWRKADLYLFGDSLSDVKQANHLLHHDGQRFGVVVNPRFAGTNNEPVNHGISPNIPTVFLHSLNELDLPKIAQNRPLAKSLLVG